MYFKASISALLLVAGSILVTGHISAAVRTWDGGGANDNWNTPANWNGDLTSPVSNDALTFDGTVRLTPNNNLPADSNFGPITFTAGAGSFVIGGNRITLAGILTDSSPNPQIVNLAARLSGNRTISVDPGAALTLGGVISQTGGSFGLTKSGTGTLTMGSNNTYTGATILDGGTLAYSVNQTAVGALNIGATPTASFASTNLSTLDLTNASVTASSLTVQTNSATANTITIGAGKTLTVNGAFTVGVGTVFTESNGSARTALTVTGSSLVINAGPNSFQVGVPRSNAAGGTDPVANLDMSGLSNFTYNGSGTGTDAEFRVGQGGNITGTLLLANTSNIIIANNLRVGDTNQPNPGSNGGNNGGAGTMTLGAGSNTINVNSIVISAGKSAATVSFPTGNTTGTLAIAGIAGGNSTADITLGNASASTNSGTGGLLNLDGHASNIQAGTVLLGRLSGSTGGTTAGGTVHFDTGTFNVVNLRFANQESGTNSNGATGTFFLGGPTAGSPGTGVLNVSGQFYLANRTNASGGTAAGTFNVFGGTANVNTDIIDASTIGTRTTTLTVDGGTLNMLGHNIGSYSAPITTINLNNGNFNNAGTVAGTTINLTSTINVAGAPTFVLPSGGTLNSALTPLTLASGGGIGGGGATAGTINGDVVAGSGSRLSPGGGTVAGTLQFNNNLTLNGGSTTRFKLSDSVGSGNDQIAVNGNLTVGGTVNVEIGATGAGPQVGNSYTVLSSIGTLTATQSNFNVIQPGSRPIFSVSTATANQVQIVVSGNPSLALKWIGNVNANWDLNSTSNFRNPSLASDKFFNFDTVTFDDTSTNVSDVQLAGALVPISVTVNATRNYKFAGAGSITGSTGLTKSGAGTLILASNNTYTGVTSIQSGTLQVGDGGTIGTLGTGDVANEGGLIFNRSDAITVNNTIGGTAGTLTQQGSGTVTLGGSNTLAGGLNINNGTVRLTNGAGAGTGAISVNSGTTLVVAANISNPITITSATLGSVTSPTLAGDLTIAPSGATIYSADPQNLSTASAVTLTGNLHGSGNISVVSGTGVVDPDSARVFALRGTAISDYTGTITLGHNTKGEIQITTAGGPSPAGTAKFVLAAGDVKLDNTSDAVTTTGGYSDFNIRNNTTGDVTFGNNVEVSGSGLAVLNAVGTAPLGATATMGSLKIGGGQQLGVHASIGVIAHNILFPSVSLTGGNVIFQPKIPGFGTVTSVGSDLTLSNITETAASSITMSGLRTLYLNGTNSYTGPTLVSSGTLGGTGNVPGTLTVNSGAFLSPGDNTVKIGTLTTNTVSLAGTLNIDVNDSDANVKDLLKVTGALTLNSASANFNITGTLSQPFYVVAQYGSLSGGPFASVTGLPNNYVLQTNYLNLNQMALVSVPLITLGDFTRDGQVTPADIPAMLKALADLKAYKSTNFLSDQQLLTIGDFDTSGTITNGDIQGLLDLIASNGGGSVAAVPEPASLLLWACGGLAIWTPRLRLRKRESRQAAS